jgi:hypothetical protein
VERGDLIRRWFWAFENDASAFEEVLHPDIEWFPIDENYGRLHGIEAAFGIETSGATPGTSIASTSRRWRRTPTASFSTST